MSEENLDIKKILNLAIQNHKKNNYIEASKLYEKVLNIDHNHFETNFYLGTLHAQNGNLKKASTYLNKAIEINPKIADLHNNLGLIFREMGELEKACNCIKKAIQINPQYAIAHSNLGLIYKELGQFENAKKCFEKSIEINPKHENPYNNLGLIYKELGQLEQAEKNFKKSIEINSRHVQAFINLGNIFKNSGEIEKAEMYYEDAISINPKYFEAYNNLMDLLERTNQNEKLNKLILKAEDQFKLNPIVKLFYGQYLYKTQEFSEAIKNLEKIKFDNNQSNRERLRSLILAKSYDQLKNFNKAFDYFSKTNEINLSNKDDNIDKIKTIKIIEKRLNFFGNPEIKNWPTQKKLELNENPIFLIGFPRSGTTLLDTILRSHPSVEVIEEEPILANFISSLNKITKEDFNNLKNIEENKLNEIRKIYFSNRDKFIKNKDNKKIYIDKMPLNIIHVGEIYRIFPDAKFLVSLRHPCDCVISCFMQSFTLNNAMANFLNLEDTANLYDHVMRLWDQYNSIFSLKFHITKYEDIVMNFEKSVNEIMNFLNLPWSDNVLKFYETAEKRELISTPSYDQVNKPIYTKSIDRWKKYEKHFTKILPILETWIKKYNY